MFDVVGLNQFFRKDEDSNEKKIKNKGFNKTIIASITISVLLLLSYFYFIGRERYFVRSDVVVRKAGNESSAQSGLSTLLGVGNQGSIEDARYLRTYLESPQVLDDLQKLFNFKKEYSKKLPDLYPGLWPNASRENVYNVFRKQIGIQLNDTTGVIRISTIAFDPETAVKFNKFLINQAEKFVNKLNQDIYKKQLDFVQNQVKQNSIKLNIANENLQNFQRSNLMLNADSEAYSGIARVASLESQLVSKNLELNILKNQFVDLNAPEILYIKDEISGIEKQIYDERKSLVSPQGKNLEIKSTKLAELKSLVDFASDLYKGALTAAEKTRLESVKQKRFMAILSNPIKPEDPWQYWRHKGFLTSLTILLVGFSLTKFLLGMADSHRN